MATIGIKRTTDKADTVQAWQVMYLGTAEQYALLDVYVPTTGEDALTIHVGQPDAGLLASQPTKGRAKTKVGFIGDQGDTVPDDLSGVLEYVQTKSVESYIAPRLALMLARVHGKALAA